MSFFIIISRFTDFFDFIQNISFKLKKIFKVFHFDEIKWLVIKNWQIRIFELNLQITEPTVNICIHFLSF